MYKASAIAWTIAVLLFTTSSARSIEEDDRATGVLQLTEEQYRELLGGETDLPVVQIGEHEYSALQSDLDRITTKPEPSCSDLFDKFMIENRPIFQSLANKNCHVYIVIWHCPYGGYWVFTVKPYRICNWKDPIYIPKIPVWEWPQLQIEIPEKEILRT